MSRGTGGVVVVAIADIAIAILAIVGLLLVGNDQNQIAIVTAALGAIGTVTGAYFGVKVAGEAREDTSSQLADAAKALSDATNKIAHLGAATEPDKGAAALEAAKG